MGDPETHRSQKAGCQIVACRCELKKLWQWAEANQESPATPTVSEAPSSDTRCDGGSTCGGKPPDCVLCDCDAWWDLYIGRRRYWLPSHDNMASRSRDSPPNDLRDLGSTCDGKASDCEVYDCNAFLRFDWNRQKPSWSLPHLKTSHVVAKLAPEMGVAIRDSPMAENASTVKTTIAPPPRSSKATQFLRKTTRATTFAIVVPVEPTTCGAFPDSRKTVAEESDFVLAMD